MNNPAMNQGLFQSMCLLLGVIYQESTSTGYEQEHTIDEYRFRGIDRS